MIRLTKTGALFLGVAVLLYGASLTSQSGLLLLPIGVLLGCILINLASAWNVVRAVEVQPPESIHVSEGERLNQPWRLRNRRARPASLVEISSRAGTILRCAFLGGRDEASIQPDLAYARRGVYANAGLKLSSRHPFGFAQASRTLDLPGEIVVHPALYPAPHVAAAGFDAMVGGRLKGSRRTASGTHFAGVRPAQAGDPLKQIHWKSSAKGQGLMVKTFEEELSGRVAFIMDSGHTGNDTVLDDCVRATGSLMFSALDEGHHVEWITLGTLEPELIPPFADGQVILEELARVELAAGCLTEERLRRAISAVSSRAALAFVLTEFNADVSKVLAELAGQRRVVTLYLPDSLAVPAELHGQPLHVYGKDHIRTER